MVIKESGVAVWNLTALTRCRGYAASTDSCEKGCEQHDSHGHVSPRALAMGRMSAEFNTRSTGPTFAFDGNGTDVFAF